jgi:Flp pilus assembly protein TadG
MLLLVLFGIIDFGRMLNAQITLTQAAREGARAAAYGQTTATVTQRVRDAAGGLEQAELTVPTVTVCTAGGSARVETRYSFSFVTPVSVFAGMFGATPAGTYNLTATGVVTCPS